MANTGKKMIFASLLLGTVIGTTLGSSPSVISASLAVFGISTGAMSFGIGLLIAISFGLVFGVGLALIGFGITGLLYESNQHPKSMTGIRIGGGISTMLGASGIGALIGNMIVPGLGLPIGGGIGLFLGLWATTIITHRQNNSISQRMSLYQMSEKDNKNKAPLEFFLQPRKPNPSETASQGTSHTPAIPESDDESDPSLTDGTSARSNSNPSSR